MTYRRVFAQARAFLLATALATAWASPGSARPAPGLAPASADAAPKVLTGPLKPKEERHILFEGRAGDLAYGTFDGPVEGDYTAVVTGPAGNVVHQIAPGLVSFVMPATGSYRASIATRKGTGRFQLSMAVARQSALGAIAGQELLGPRITAQAKALAEGQGDTSAFWSGVESSGTPLIEKDGDDFLVTFLWRGDADTRSVKLSWPFFHIAPVIDLHRLGRSDIWFRSVRLAPGTRFAYRLHPNAPNLEGPPMVQALALTAVGRADPYNPNRSMQGGGQMSEVALAPSAAPSRWVEKNTATATGKTTSFDFASTVLGNSRRISVYTPPGYRPECGPYRMIVLFDGAAYQTIIPVPTILDNLIAAGEIAPTVAVFVDSVSIAGRAGELHPNEAFTEMIARELMDEIRSRYAVSRDPKDVVLGGFSLGGLSATHIAWRHPETFGAVLSQSGAFWWSDEAIRAGRGEPILKEGPILDPGVESFELVTKMAQSAPALPLRIHLDAGLYEGDLLTGNRFLRDVLKARSYDFTYREFPGGHDPTFWRDSFGDALMGLVGLREQPQPAQCGAAGRDRASR